VTTSIRASSIRAVGYREISDCWMYAVGVGKVALVEIRCWCLILTGGGGGRGRDVGPVAVLSLS
jgi:hypothetical protein